MVRGPRDRTSAEGTTSPDQQAQAHAAKTSAEVWTVVEREVVGPQNQTSAEDLTTLHSPEAAYGSR